MDMPSLLLFFLLLLLLIFPSLSFSSTTLYQNCSNFRSCGANTVPYPFTFDPTCGPIHLKCSKNTIRIGKFQVRNITADAILVLAPPSCSRPISDAAALFGNSFALSSKNALLLRNCTAAANSNSSASSSTCGAIPMGILPHSPENTTSCPAEEKNVTCFYYKEGAAASSEVSLMPWSDVFNRNCSTLYSSMAIHGGADNTTSVFDFETVELSWWVDGNCTLCHDNAKCARRNDARGVTCICKEGFVGDGFNDGAGCKRAGASDSSCTASKYVTGSCSGKSTKLGLLIAGIVCGAVLMALFAAAYYFIRKHSTVLRSRKSTKRLLSEASCTVPLFLYREIERATNNFSERNRLGTGAYGTVYVGRLHNDEEVAIKKLRHRGNDSVDQVLNEIKLLSSVSHPNLVRLLGCCLEGDDQILVYEFMANGTLAEHLQRERGQGLPWTVRINIASDTAKAIAHLHSAIHPPIYHRDIKSSNILLDHNFNSKIADFGLSKMIVTELSHVSTAPQGTPGYLDPQYHQNFHLSDKSDVYSFGVVLVEIITAMKVVDFSRGQSDVNLAAMAINKIAKGSVEDIIDPFLDPNRDAWTLSSIHKVAELAFRCLAFHKDMRPSMMEVAEELEQIRMSGWAPVDDDTLVTTASSICSSPSSCTDRSRVSAFKIRRPVYVSHIESQARGCSPVSIDDPWRSEQSSPSADSLLGSTTR